MAAASCGGLRGSWSGSSHRRAAGRVLAAFPGRHVAYEAESTARGGRAGMRLAVTCRLQAVAHDADIIGWGADLRQGGVKHPGGYAPGAAAPPSTRPRSASGPKGRASRSRTAAGVRSSGTGHQAPPGSRSFAISSPSKSPGRDTCAQNLQATSIYDRGWSLRVARSTLGSPSAARSASTCPEPGDPSRW